MLRFAHRQHTRIFPRLAVDADCSTVRPSSSDGRCLSVDAECSEEQCDMHPFRRMDFSLWLLAGKLGDMADSLLRGAP